MLTFENEKARKMVRERASTKIQYYALGCMDTFITCTSQYQFGHTEQQLLLLQMLKDCLANAKPQVDLAALESLLMVRK